MGSFGLTYRLNSAIRFSSIVQRSMVSRSLALITVTSSIDLIELIELFKDVCFDGTFDVEVDVEESEILKLSSAMPESLCGVSISSLYSC